MPDNSGGVVISMDQNDNNNLVLPGFRFHPTEEELVDFYLRRMVEGKRLAIDLIAMVDLYRHDPWELPAMAIIGEKEWFFFAPREQKYPNGARPNRVTTSGYWKATGTDRIVRSSQGCRCIGLKKTLVFYTGRAPRGIRTNWIMNEYRLPQQENTDNPLKNQVALCRVYRKASSEGFHDSACENAALRRTTKENHRRASPSRLSREDEGNRSSNGSPSSNSIHEPLFQDLTSDKPGIGNVHSLKHQTEIVTQQAQNAQVGGFHPWQIEQNSETSPSPIQLGFFHSNLGQASFLPEQESNMLPALQSNISNSEGEGIRNSGYLRNSILGSYTNSAGYTPHAMEAVGSNLYYLKLLFPDMEDQNRSFNSLPGSDDSNQTACVPPSWIRHSSSRPNQLHGHDQLPSQYEFLDTSNILHRQQNIDKFWDSNVWSSSTGGGGSFQSSMCPSQR